MTVGLDNRTIAACRGAWGKSSGGGPWSVAKLAIEGSNPESQSPSSMSGAVSVRSQN